MDTGIDIFHPDLNLAGGVDCTDSQDGINDLNGHGTHVAGIAAARDNDIGVVGVAPGARVWAVKVFDIDGTSSESRILCGMEWVADNADVIDVVNMSFGDGQGSDDGNCGRSNRDSIHRAICRATRDGVTMVAAAGNGAADAASTTPAAYDEVITVSALADYDGGPGGLASPSCSDFGKDDGVATFSNFGADVDLIAPGVCIASTFPSSGYALLSGTSMATPHVSGGAALYISEHTEATPDEVREALIDLGSQDRSPDGDPDGITEPLLDVGEL
jgi:subtilisin family serine protease